MNFKETILPFLLIGLGIFAIAGILTFVSVHNFKNECVENGGTPKVEGGTVWCRY